MDLHSLTHLLLSVSLISFIVSYSASYSYLIHSFKFQLPIYLSQILSKNCIFLIFNGILVFLAKTSGCMKFSAETSEPNEPLASDLLDNIIAGEENQDLNLILENKELDIEVKESILEDEPKGEVKIDIYSVQEEDCKLDFLSDNKEEEQKENGDHDEILSSDDLNKKFDEFIRRMKEEIRTGVRMKEEFRIGAQQQLVMVY